MTTACPSPRKTRIYQGFTLIELLVAVAVLSLLIIMIGQLVGWVGQAITANTKRMDAATQARLVFDRFEMDIAGRPQRSDIGINLTKAAHGPSDTIAFYSTVAGYGGTRNLSLVVYQIDESTAGRLFQLERGAGGTDWSGSNQISFPTLLPSTANLLSANYDVVAPGAFRLDFRFLLKTGMLSNSVPNNDMTQISGVAMALAILDNNSRLLLSNPATQLPQLAQAFTDGVATDQPIAAWNSTLNKAGGFSVTGIPKQAIQGIRLFQRTFYVP